jgi:hypothetical protein
MVNKGGNMDITLGEWEKRQRDEHSKYLSKFMTKAQIKVELSSLDFSLAILIQGEEKGFGYPVALKRVRDAVQEPGPFWDAVLDEAVRKLDFDGKPATPSNCLLVKELAIETGIDWLIDAYKKGL